MRLRQGAFGKKARADMNDEKAERESQNIDMRKLEEGFSQATMALSLSGSASGGFARGSEASPAQPHGNGRSDYIPRE